MSEEMHRDACPAGKLPKTSFLRTAPGDDEMDVVHTDRIEGTDQNVDPFLVAKPRYRGDDARRARDTEAAARLVRLRGTHRRQLHDPRRGDVDPIRMTPVVLRRERTRGLARNDDSVRQTRGEPARETKPHSPASMLPPVDHARPIPAARRESRGNRRQRLGRFDDVGPDPSDDLPEMPRGARHAPEPRCLRRERRRQDVHVEARIAQVVRETSTIAAEDDRDADVRSRERPQKRDFPPRQNDALLLVRGAVPDQEHVHPEWGHTSLRLEIA